MSEPRIRRRGLLLVLSSPSGAGKTTITRRLVEEDPALTLSVSVTTRRQRPGEIDGRDYRFIDQTRFDEMAAQGELLEHARVFGNCYGTPRRPIDAAIDEGVPAHVLTAALYERFDSRGAADFADKLLSAMRYEFGGHLEKKA